MQFEKHLTEAKRRLKTDQHRPFRSQQHTSECMLLTDLIIEIKISLIVNILTKINLVHNNQVCPIYVNNFISTCEPSTFHFYSRPVYIQTYDDNHHGSNRKVAPLCI